MKNAFLALISVFVLAFLIITGCASDNTPTGPHATATAVVTATVTQTSTSTASPTETATPRLDAYVTIRKLMHINNERTPSPSNFYSIEIRDAGTPVVNATVVVNATPVAYEGLSGNYGRYRMFGVSAITGVTYTTNIYYKELTLTASILMPGGQVLNANADAVTWTDGGDSRSIDIFNSVPVETYWSTMPTSPHLIPMGTAFPAADTYSIACVIRKYGTYTGTAVPYLNAGTSECDEYFQYSINK